MFRIIDSRVSNNGEFAITAKEYICLSNIGLFWPAACVLQS
jgi:hypothetical protein